MGFQPPERKATIRGEDDYAGFEAQVSLSMPLSESLAFTAALNSGDGKHLADTMSTFGDDVLISWNLEFTAKSAAKWNKAHVATTVAVGDPVPATGEGLMAHDNAFANVLIGAFTEALTAPPLTSSGTPVLGATPASEDNQLSGAATSS